MSVSRIADLCLLLAATLGLQAVVTAQTPQQSPTFSVSVTEPYELIEEVGTVRRIGRTEIEARNARTLDEALRLLPGIYVRTGGDGTPRIDIRGFRSRHVLLLIYVGIDDTDVVGGPGTNQLARKIVRRLGRVAKGAIVCRHQLFFDPRVPFSSGNGSASIQLPHGDEIARDALIVIVREEMLAFFVEGSDPGLAVAASATDDMQAFAARAKTEVVRQSDARAAVERSECHLEGLGGTNQGIIGAVAAVACAAGGDDGRVVHLEEWPWPDTMGGVQPVSAVRDRGVVEIRSLSEDGFTGDEIDVGKRLRPNWRGGRVVLFVEPPAEAGLPWRAVKLDGRE